MAKAILLLWSPRSAAQGIVTGRITDATGAPVPGALVELSCGKISVGAKSDDEGSFRFSNVPVKSCRLRVSALAFRIYEAMSDASANVRIRLELAPKLESIVVTESAPAVDRQLLASLPALSADSGLNDSITFATAGVAADSNGFFHPMGDHAQVTFVIDGQPISDQRNKVFSTSIPANAIQSMEVLSDSPGAEYGDKTSLIVNASTMRPRVLASGRNSMALSPLIMDRSARLGKNPRCLLAARRLVISLRLIPNEPDDSWTHPSSTRCTTSATQL